MMSENYEIRKILCYLIMITLFSVMFCGIAYSVKVSGKAGDSQINTEFIITDKAVNISADISGVTDNSEISVNVILTCTDGNGSYSNNYVTLSDPQSIEIIEKPFGRKRFCRGIVSYYASADNNEWNAGVDSQKK